MIVLLVIVGLLLTMAISYWVLMSPYSQFFGNFPYKLDTHEKIIALTFDDGPNEPYTSQIADYLTLKKIRATFFQVGKCVERFPETTRKIAADGHIIGNHTLSHEFHKYFFHSGFDSEIQLTQTILRRQLNKTPLLFRPPWLWRTPMIMRTIRKYSLRPISGRFCYIFEIFQPDCSQIAKRAIAKARPGAIIIFHDGFDSRGGNRHETVKAVKITVETLLKQGYKFVTVDELFGVKPYYLLNQPT